MKAEEKVKRMFPNASIEHWPEVRQFRVTIIPGRYTYGRLKSWAWVNALDSISQDAELLSLAAKPSKSQRTPP